jgi:glyoxylase-like metal-dependent hydrolase (beta-lactamase superfamily II)
MPGPAPRAQLTLGSTTITYLPDGYGSHNPDVVFAGVDWDSRPGYLVDGELLLTFGSFLIQAAERNILVDLAVGKIDVEVPGYARLVGGTLQDNLAAEGLTADDIDTVVYTHLHLDHVGWTSDVAPLPTAPATAAPTGLTFARARHLMSEAEWRHWSETIELGGPDRDVVLAPLTGVVEFVTDGEVLAPGVSVQFTAGHTPGHVAIVVRDPAGSSSEAVYLVGDILHSPAQILEPGLRFTSDHDPAAARAVRDRVLTLPDAIIGAGHFTDAVFGRVATDSNRRTWTPVDGA